MKYLFVILAFAYSSQNNAQSQFIDTSFGTNNGYTINQMATDDFAFTSIIQHNNAIYAVHTKLGGDLYLSKYNLNGVLDFNFGINGFVDINSNLTYEALFQGRKNILISSDNKLIITSSARPVVGGETPDTIVAKLNLDGTFDLNYGINGHVVTNFTYGQGLIGSFKYPQDDILLVFNKPNTSPVEVTELNLLKINADGNLDSTFGSNGRLMLPSDYDGYRPKLAIIKDQAVYIHFTSAENNDYIKKFDLGTSNYDMQFGINGKLMIGDDYPFQSLSSFTIDENNIIYVVGPSSSQDGNIYVNVLKFVNEVLDLSFGINGISESIIANNMSGLYSINILESKIVVLGELYSTTNPENTSFLAQLNLNGTLDANFGENGVIFNEMFDDLHLAFDYIHSEDSIITGGLCPIGDGEFRPCLIKYYTNNNLGSNSLDQNNFAFYPNPVTSELHFQTTEDVTKIIIYDILGRVVKSEFVSQNKIDLSEITSGTYIVKAQSDTKTQTFKLIKA